MKDEWWASVELPSLYPSAFIHSEKFKDEG